MKSNKKVFTPIIIILIIILIYALGFSSNVAYANKDNIVDPSAYPIHDFNVGTVQPFNNLIFYFVIILFLMLLAVYLTGSHTRKKYLKSNVITISVLSGGMITFALINLIRLPKFIATYSQLLIDHPDQIARSKRISSLIPTNNMYYIGIVISVISLVYAIFMIVYLIKRMRTQNEYFAKRSEVLANAI